MIIVSRSVFEDLEPQDPAQSSGYLASFTGLSVKAVLLDEVMLNPDKPSGSLIVEFETKVTDPVAASLSVPHELP